VFALQAPSTALLVGETVLQGSEDGTAQDARRAFLEAAGEAGLSGVATIAPTGSTPDRSAISAT
jgi:hypothetical protein